MAYGNTSPYESLNAGLCVVAMRSAGAAAGTSPVISTQITVQAGRAYTVAGLGPAADLDLRVLDDQLDAPTGKAAVRVIEASLRTPEVSIDAADATLAGSLRFPAVTGYTDLAPGKRIVSVTAPGTVSQDELDFAPNDNYALAVVDGAGGTPRVLDLTDSASTAVMPKGGVATGFGGTAQQHADALAADVPWALLVLVGAGATVYAGKRLRRN